MKSYFILIYCLVGVICTHAQSNLTFQGHEVDSIIIFEYGPQHSNQVIFRYDESQIITKKKVYERTAKTYENAANELQQMLEELPNYQCPTAESLGIDSAIITKQFFRSRYRRFLNDWRYYKRIPSLRFFDEELVEDKKCLSLETFNKWLCDRFSSLDSVMLIMNTSHGLSGLKIKIVAKDQDFVFDMTDQNLFQEYSMISPSINGLKYYSNFNVNKHIVNLFNQVKIKRQVPWVTEILEAYFEDINLQL